MKKHAIHGAVPRARALRQNMTGAEKRIWQTLRSQQTDGYRFRRQVPIGRYIADFVCHQARLIIEVDGGQHERQSASEVERSGFLLNEGYRVLRFWNNEVLENLDGVYAVIIGELAGVTPTPTLPHRGGGCDAAPVPKPLPLDGGGGHATLRVRLHGATATERP